MLFQAIVNFSIPEVMVELVHRAGLAWARLQVAEVSSLVFKGACEESLQLLSSMLEKLHHVSKI